MRPVAIVGFAPSSRDLANTLPADVEIWGENQLYEAGFLKRADRWFELHARSLFDTTLPLRRPKGYVQWLRDFAGPVYMLEQHADIPPSVRYPLEDVTADVGSYLTSTIAMMLGLAIHLRAPTIYVYGVDMAFGDYERQRACCEHLLGLAIGRGITITVPDSSPLLKGPLYGRGTGQISDTQFTRRLQALEQRKVDLQTQIARTQVELHAVQGAIAEVQYWINVTPEGAPPPFTERRNGQAVELILA